MALMTLARWQHRGGHENRASPWWAGHAQRDFRLKDRRAIVKAASRRLLPRSSDAHCVGGVVSPGWRQARPQVNRAVYHLDRGCEQDGRQTANPRARIQRIEECIAKPSV